tara:strand:+ start:213 stop:374 length:162 start_codon:yes stop_codon:yes gene_type:complete
MEITVNAEFSHVLMLDLIGDPCDRSFINLFQDSRSTSYQGVQAISTLRHCNAA